MFPASHVRAVEPNGVVVGELAWAGSSVSSADEWLELRNLTDQLVDLAGWSLWNSAVVPPRQLVGIDEGQLAPDGTFLIAAVEADHAFTAGQSVLAADPDLVASGLVLSNSHLMLELRDSTGAVIDRVGDGGRGFLRDRSLVRSMERRLDPLGDGDQPSSWQLSSTQYGFDSGVLDQGTPTPSGRPSLRSTASLPCRLDLTSDRSASPILVTDPDGVADVTNVTGRVGDVPVNAEIEPTTGQLTVTVAQVQPGPALLTLTATDRHGLSRTVAVPCEVVNGQGEVLIDEVSPAPSSGEREFVELRNGGLAPVNLFGWSLDDRDRTGGQPFRIRYSLPLSPGERTVLWGTETKLALNNDGDDVQLIRPDGSRADLVRYSETHPNQSWNRESPWYWSLPSPGRVNNGPIPAPPTGQGGAPTTPTLPVVALNDLVAQHRLLAGSLISTEGSVTIEQGVYDDRRLVLGTTTAGLELQLPAGMTLPYKAGTTLHVTGRVSTAGTPRLLIDGPSAAVAIGTGNPIVSDLTALEHPAELQFVSAVGRVKTAGAAPVIRVGPWEVHLSRRETVHLPTLREAQTVALRGVVTEVDPLRITVLKSDDLRLIDEARDPAAAPVVPAVSQPKPTPGGTQPQAPASIESSVGTQTVTPARASVSIDVLRAVVASLQVRSELADQLTARVLGARTEVALPVAPQPVLLAVTASALLGVVLLWLDLLIHSLHRRLLEQ